jgi:RND superfamily putative drug exporter
MQPSGFTGVLARASARHPWTTLVAWVVLLALAVLGAGTLGDVLTEDGDLTVATESETAHDLIAAAREASAENPGDSVRTEFVIVESETDLTAVDPTYQAFLAELSADIASTEHVLEVIGPDSGAPGLVSADGRYALLRVSLEDIEDSAEAVGGFVETIAAADASDAFRVVPIGNGSVTVEFNTLAEETLVKGETLGLPMALLVLILVFGAVVAALIPIGLAVVSIIGAVGLTVLVGQFMDLNFFIVNMITMIGLAVGIDYSLFVVQRFREERQHGRDKIDAITVAGDTASRAVFFSGVTVVIALLGLMIMPETTMRSLGIGAIVVVVASVAAAMTLLPAILSLLGDRVNRLRVPFMHRELADSHRFWNRITAVVTRRPVVSVALAGGLLVALALPYLSIAIGSNFINSLPEDSDIRHGFEVLADEFGGGIVTTPIAVEGEVDAPAVQQATAALVAALGADEAFGEVTVEPLSATLVVVDATNLVDPSTDEGRAAVQRLRGDLIPAAYDGLPVAAYVGGDAAFVTDMVDVIQSRTPLIFAFVLGLSFLILMLVFRSLVVPLKAILMNLLSVGATYGALVAAFQWGWGASLFGFQQTDVIESWVPLFLFAVLFGLSMDYHVFLLSRIKERYDRTKDNSGSVAFGLSATGAIITGAALIMVAVFGGFAAGDLVMFQQMGFGLAVAVILDATIVRSVLVPATMELLGDRNWYLPSWLHWLPEIHIEAPAPLAAGAPDEDVVVLPEAASTATPTS